MEILIEILLQIVLEPIFYILIELPAEAAKNALPKKKYPIGVRILLLFLIILAQILMIATIIAGIALLATGKEQDEKDAGLFFLIIGLVMLAVYAVIVTVRVTKKKRKKKSEAKEAESGDGKSSLEESDINVYKNCPVLENDKYLLRLTSDDDISDLLKVLFRSGL